MPNQQIMTWNNLLPASMATAILTLLTTAVTTSAAPTNDLLGHIQVLNTTSFATANPADAIGCLDTRGRLVRDDCAVFSQLANAPHTFSTSAGVCTFRNTSRPANTDSMYGKGNHAWWCGDKLNDPVVESYYPAVSASNYTFLCNGNLDCYYDILATPPSKNTDPLPVWQFAWGSLQVDVPAGHSEVLWLWVPL